MSGHPNASRYPLGAVLDEHSLVSKQINSRIVTEAVLFQLAASSILSKKAGQAFEKQIKRLTPDG